MVSSCPLSPSGRTTRTKIELKRPQLGLDRAAKALRNHVKVPWELNEMFGDFLPEEADGADEDEVEAYEDSKKRLKVGALTMQRFVPLSHADSVISSSQELDDITRDMTKEQYMHYSECRAASFTYRKSELTVPRARSLGETFLIG